MLRNIWKLLPVVCLAGCANDSTPPTAAPSSSPTADPVVSATPADDAAAAAKPADVVKPMEFKPLSLAPGGAGSGVPVAGTTPVSKDQSISNVIDRLKPLQVMLGQWRGTTRREYDGFKAVDTHEWLWDLQTDPQQPALVLKSDKSPYLRSARITWDTQNAKFLLTATDKDEVTRQYMGDYTDPVHEIVGPDDKMHRVFRLEFTQTETPDNAAGNESWQVAFAQQENDRYLLELAQRRGKAAFRRYDTVSTQRQGTSFAVSDTDYGEKECIISQGLGTISVSYQGKTYWVCCSGCKAAFEEDPATWIARAEKRAAEK